MLFANNQVKVYEDQIAEMQKQVQELDHQKLEQ